MQKFFQDMETGNKKKLLYQGIVAFVVLVLVAGFLYMIKPRRKAVTPYPQIKTKQEDLTKESWLSIATKRLEEQKKRMNALEKQLEEIKKATEEIKKRPSTMLPPPPPPPKEKEKPVTPFRPISPPPPPPPGAPAPSTAGTKTLPQQQVSRQVPVETADLIAVVKGSGSAKTHPGVAVAEQPAKKEQTKKTRAASVENTIPAGSFTSGILLSGLDAPTGGKASSSPHPVLIRLIDTTILPNKFETDMRSCFVIGEGYGDLSSERAYIRLNTLSCIKEDGTVIQKQIEGYVSGEDGKIGLKGRVVSKQGALLARTLIAGFLEGAGNILQYQGTNVSISPLGATQTVEPGEITKLSLYSGSASAAKKLAEFYMKLVNETFPVVEINAGRKVEIVFLKEVKLT